MISYRAWIDRGGPRPFLAVQLLVWTLILGVVGLGYSVFVSGWSWITVVALVCICSSVYLALAQSNWRQPGHSNRSNRRS